MADAVATNSTQHVHVPPLSDFTIGTFKKNAVLIAGVLIGVGEILGKAFSCHPVFDAEISLSYVSPVPGSNLATRSTWVKEAEIGHRGLKWCLVMQCIVASCRHPPGHP